jgi:hypothetical protein
MLTGLGFHTKDCGKFFGGTGSWTAKNSNQEKGGTPQIERARSQVD